jgi:hypothetical protein
MPLPECRADESRYEGQSRIRRGDGALGSGLSGVDPSSLSSGRRPKGRSPWLAVALARGVTRRSFELAKGLQE